jgi:hypothetical protein
MIAPQTPAGTVHDDDQAPAPRLAPVTVTFDDHHF